MLTILKCALVFCCAMGSTPASSTKGDIIQELADGVIDAVVVDTPRFELPEGTPRGAFVRIASCDGLFGYPTIQSAIDDSADGDIVVVLPNTCDPAGRWHENLDFQGRSIRLQSANPANPVIVAATILDGNSTGNTIQSLAAPPGRPTLEVDGFTFADCYRAVKLTSTDLELIRCNITATKFTALSIAGPADSSEPFPRLTVDRCNFNDNPSSRLITATNYDVQISASNFDRNRSGSVAALVFAGCELTIDHSVFTNNGMSPVGFGLLCFAGGRSATLRRCVFQGNTGTEVGCLWLAGANDYPISILDSTFVANRSGAFGGAIRNIGPGTQIENCTFIGNQGQKAGALFSHSPNLTLTGCILRNNRADVPDGPVGDQLAGFTGNVRFCNIEGLEKSGDPSNLDADPLFAEPGHWDDNATPDPIDDIFIPGDYHLLVGSPCINAGDPVRLPSDSQRDLDDQPRVMDCRIDIGADEAPGALARSGDFDFDGEVGLGDVQHMVDALLDSTTLDCVADLNGDNLRDATDLQIFVERLF